MSGVAQGQTRFLYDGDAMVAEFNSSGTILRRYVHGTNADADDPLIWYEGNQVRSSTRRFLLANHQGSIIAVTNNTGSILNANTYDEFGINGTSNAGRFQYTGQVWLEELGLYYYKARIYSPHLGRFMQTDPIGYEDTFNLYGYVGNDPINGIDPTGSAVVKHKYNVIRTRLNQKAQVTVNADFNGDGSDDLSADQISQLGEDFGQFIRNNDGADISKAGKPVSGDGENSDKAMASVVSQFVGAAAGSMTPWVTLKGIEVTSTGLPEEATTYVDGSWDLKVGPDFPATNPFLGDTSWTRNALKSPSNLARLMLHGAGHALTGLGKTPKTERLVDKFARDTLKASGLGGGGCWGGFARYQTC